MKLTMRGFDAYLQKLDRLEASSEPILRRAAYAGTQKVADAVREGIRAMPVARDTGRKRSEWVQHGDGARIPYDWERDAMLQGLGTAPMENDGGYVHSKIGFAGYYNGPNVPKTRAEKGVPVPVVARSVEKGTSFLHKQQVVKLAVRKARSGAVGEMRKIVDEEIEKIMK